MAELPWLSAARLEQVAHHAGDRRRRRRAVRRPSAGDPERARDHRANGNRLSSKWRSSSARSTVRCVAMDTSEGLMRGQDVTDTGQPIKVPVGAGTLGRIINVIGEPVDEAGPVPAEGYARHPPAGAVLCGAVDRGADPRHRHQGRRPARALRQGRQDRPVRRRRRRQDGADHGTHQQRRQGAWRLFGLRRRRRAHPRGQRPLSRDDRVERQQGLRRSRPNGLEMRARLRPDERAAGRARPRRA